MQVHPNKNPQTKVYKYQPSLKEVPKISKNHSISSNPPPQEDFNFTFLIKDYDEANPYLNKKSFIKSGYKKSKQQQETFSLEQGLFDKPLLANSEVQVLNKKQTNKEKFKLPNIKKNHKRTVEQNSKESIKTIKPKDKISYQQKQKQTCKSIRYNKSFTIDTRLQTEDASILQNASTSSLPKIQPKSLSDSIQTQNFSCLKISKISNPQAEILSRNRDLLSRQDILSGGMPEFSRLDLSPIKGIDKKVIEQEDSMGSDSQEEYIKNSVPGPGAYSISQHSSFSRPSLAKPINKTQSKNFNFGSRETRFKPENKGEQNLQVYQLKLQQYERKQKQRSERLLMLNRRQKKRVPFNCKQEPKQGTLKNGNGNCLVSPVYYNPRNGIEEQLIKKIQRNFKGAFGVAERRFRTVYRKNSQVGPGSYNTIDIRTIQQQQSKKEAYYFISNKNRFS